VPKQPLTVEVKEGRLVISLGVDTLAFAFEHSNWNNPFIDDLNDFRQQYFVPVPAAFAADVRRELRNEAEDGSTILEHLLDKACIAAVENGSTGVDDYWTKEDE
jgi:hypothetical protein